MGDAGSLLRNQALAVLTGALMSPQEMLPEVAAQAMERQFFETFVGKVGAAVLQNKTTALIVLWAFEPLEGQVAGAASSTALVLWTVGLLYV